MDWKHLSQNRYSGRILELDTSEAGIAVAVETGIAAADNIAGTATVQELRIGRIRASEVERSGRDIVVVAAAVGWTGQ